MRYSRNTSILPNARTLRKKMTRQERHLWYDFLRWCRPRFRRQEILGNYIADFFCHEAKLVIEIDGSQHYELQEKKKDDARTAYFHELGVWVLRLSNADVDNRFNSVCEGILLVLEQCGVKTTIDVAKGECPLSCGFAATAPLKGSL